MTPTDRMDDFGESLLSACSADEQRQIVREVKHLARAFAPRGDAASFDAAAEALNESARGLTYGRRHVLLWAAGFRRLARREFGLRG